MSLIFSRDAIFCMLAYKISLLIIHNTFSVLISRVPLLEIWIGPTPFIESDPGD